MNLAIIPARGGSKRIPRKNIREFCGQPIIAYSIESALASGLFDRVIVSTDDEEIAAVARDFGAEAPLKGVSGAFGSRRRCGCRGSGSGCGCSTSAPLAWRASRGRRRCER